MKFLVFYLLTAESSNIILYFIFCLSFRNKFIAVQQFCGGHLGNKKYLLQGCCESLFDHSFRENFFFFLCLAKFLVRFYSRPNYIYIFPFASCLFSGLVFAFYSEFNLALIFMNISVSYSFMLAFCLAHLLSTFFLLVLLIYLFLITFFFFFLPHAHCFFLITFCLILSTLLIFFS